MKAYKNSQKNVCVCVCVCVCLRERKRQKGEEIFLSVKYIFKATIVNRALSPHL